MYCIWELFDMAIDVSSNDINRIYEYSPAFSNLYTLELTSHDFEDINDYAVKTVDEITLQKVFRYHSSKIDFGGESLTMKRNDVTKKFQFDGSPFKRTDTITVTLRENERWAVKQYHDDWLNMFYNKDKDYYISYQVIGKYFASDALFKDLRITLPNCDRRLHLLILPNNTGGVNLGWGNSGTIITHSITYYVDSWEWEDNAT